MMGTLHIQMLVLLVILVHPRHASCSTSSSGVGKPKIKCIEAERRALLSIKDHLHNVKAGVDPLSSWGNYEEDGRNVECCKWAGIGCNNNSGHVVRLDLSPSTVGTSTDSLRGNISPSLLELKYLTHLDLSSVDFTGSRIPSSIGSLSQLRYLNLSYTGMSAEIPPQLANLSGLQVLDLSKNYELPIKSLEWVSHLSSLRTLDLSGVNLSRANDWVQRVNQLPKLKNLKLGYCDLPNVVNSPSLSFVNSSTSIAVLVLRGNDLSLASIRQWLFNSSNSLIHLDLKVNQLGGSVLESFGKMAALNYLDLSGNRLNGSIPDIFRSMSALAYLDLSSNLFEGEIPKSIWNISTLHTLRVSSNNLSGYLPETSFRQLKHLELLDLSGNSFRGVISEAHFLNLSNLSHLDLSSNSLALYVHSDWIPPFQLDVILLGSCKLGTQFPNWLRTQQNYSRLDISNSGISDSFPDWFWDLSTRIQNIDLSNNQITGEIENSSLEFQDYLVIDLSSNQLEGSIPSFLFEVSELNLSQNGFSKIDFLCDVRGDTLLGFLDISHNKLSGKLPDCWSHFKELRVLLLKNNELSGKIPISIGSLIMIETLQLTNNNFTGELPSTLKNCSELVDIDFGENGLSGPIPTWIGKSFPKLVLLSLRSNNFNGSIPLNLCNLSNLQVLDLSLNEITGSIPKCFSSFSAMKERRTTTISHRYVLHRLGEWMLLANLYEDKLQLEWKGKLTEFESNLVFVKNIDLSSNKLIGEIPTEIADLVELVSLNLSRNNLSGKIPSMIGQLGSLDVLDLSRNHLDGQIPSSLAQIDRLSTFDVSNNNLSGKIPTSTQLQSFNETAYTGNPLLCGDPLPKSCQKVQEQTAPEVPEEGADDQLLNRGFYISMALGFAISFWGVSGTLIFGKSFRCASKFKLLMMSKISSA